MSSIVAFLVTSVDGYHDSTDHGFDWHVVDGEFDAFATEQLDAADALLFGRATYLGMAQFWPTAPDSPIARRMNDMPKVVVSSTLPSADWEPGRLVRKVAELDSRNHLVLGSSTLTASLIEEGLLTELRVMVMPVVLGGGTSLVDTLGSRTQVKLIEARPFESGNVLLRYRFH